MHCFGKYIGNALYLVVVYIDKQQLLTGTLIKEKSAAESLQYFMYTKIPAKDTVGLVTNKEEGKNPKANDR